MEITAFPPKHVDVEKKRSLSDTQAMDCDDDEVMAIPAFEVKKPVRT